LVEAWLIPGSHRDRRRLGGATKGSSDLTLRQGLPASGFDERRAVDGSGANHFAMRH
jgi:hypothetical protein